jgi:hypothetical protein
VARFLAVESCGQCEPCKRDGVALSEHLAAISRSQASERDLRAVDDRLRTVADGARCYLASLQQRVLGSILERFGDDLRAHLGRRPGVEPMLVSPLLEVADGEALIDGRHARKQPDWSHDATDSGASPAALGDAVPLEIGDGRPGPDEDLLAEGAVPNAGDGGPNPLSRRLRRSHVRLMDELVAAEDHAHVGGEPGRPGVDAGRRAPDAPSVIRDDVGDRRAATEDGRGRAGDADGRHVANTFEDAIAMLEHDLRVHLDSVERVLYPMVRRVGGDEGETVAAHAEVQRDRALQGLRALNGTAERPDTSAVRTLGDEVRTVLSVETAEMLPILQRSLDRQQLRDLANALSDAAASLPDASVDNDVV